MARKILIVDPDPDSAEELFLLFHSDSIRLNATYYEPEIAVCVRDALEKISNDRFACVILDADLPEMPVDEAIPLLRAIHRDIPIVVVAAVNNLEMEARIRRSNVQYYHIRSYDPEELKLAVRMIGETARRANGPPRTGRSLPARNVLKPLTLYRSDPSLPSDPSSVHTLGIHATARGRIPR